MPNFIKINEEDRIKLFNNLKSEINIPWRVFYPKFNISKSSFFNYLSGRNKIPEELFNKFMILAKTNIMNKQILECPRYKKKTIHAFKLDRHLAEILGILNGDGHISKSKYEICVVGSILERDYYNYLKNLFENKFGTKFTLREEETTFKLRLYSKDFLSCYIRGLYDTDGCFHIRRKNDPMISITSADRRFLLEVTNALNYLGYNTAKGDQRVFIYRKKDVNKFFKEIEPSNSKHLKKYNQYLEQASIA